MTRSLSLALTLSAGMALAEGHNLPADLSFTCNEHGAVVTVANGPTYYLGNACGAYQPGVGEGRWWYAASGFVVDIGGNWTKFNNDLDCPITFCRS